MELIDIVKKLVGRIEPAGDESIDGEILENMKTAIKLTEDLISEIDNVVYRNIGSHQHSIKEIVKAGDDFLSKIIKE